MSSPAKPKRTILFLAANPKNSDPLNLDKEVSDIEEGLQRAQRREEFQLIQKWAVQTRDIGRALLDHKPQIVHFSGHGAGDGGLVLEDEVGQAKLVTSAGLANLFELFSDQIECVVLNACYSQVQAEAIVRHIPYVIGMKQEVGDNAARKFAEGFYDALGAGQSIEFAFKFGCAAISMEGIPESLTPVIKRKSATSDPLPLPVPPAPTLVPAQSRSLNEAPVSLDNPDDGSVSLDSNLYIERPPIEANCYEAILRPGALIRVKAPRQMGKSSLLQRVLNHAHQHECKVAYLNFQSADAEFLTNIDKLLQWFCASISNELNMPEKLEEYWKGVLGSKNKCTNYFQRYLLTEIGAPLALGLDEVDQVFQHRGVAQEFFGLLRAWHEKGRNEASWKKLRLVIVHSKEVYIPLNINQSPFNVGLPIELPELTQPQVTDLVDRHGLNWSSVQVEQLMGMVDGHPYLVRKALYEIARGYLLLETFLQVAPTEAGLYGEHLRRHLINLKGDPELEAAMKQVVSSNYPVRLEPSLGFKLRSMGLVRLQGNDVAPLCNLYRTYFRDRLGVG